MKHFIGNACRTATLVVMIAFAAINVAQAKNIGKQNLLELMSHTDSIVVGTVNGTTDGFHRGLPYTEITIKVGRSIKGDHGEEFSFRQFGLLEPKLDRNGRINLMVTPAGWPRYADGEQVMLFLHKPASETGFQTTAALTQGKFSISGSRIANGINNQDLFKGLEISRRLPPNLQDLVNQAGGSYQLDAFLELVQTAIDEQWIEEGVMRHED